MLARQGSNLNSSDPESDVLPVTPRANTFIPDVCGPDESRTHDL